MSPVRNSARASGPRGDPSGADGGVRPLSARSVIASLLLGSEIARLPGAALVRWCALFGISEGTARVALSRMTAAGELEASDAAYSLAGPLLERRSYQDWSLHPRLRKWKGDWSLEVVTGPRRPANERAALRTAMARRRMRELREGVWTRPANLPPDAVPPSSLEVTSAQCSPFVARPADDDASLAAELFDPDAWARRARRLLDRVDSVTSAIDSGDHSRLAEGFTTGAAVLVHIRSDPLLPPELVADDFPGAALRGAYLRYQDVYRRETREWFLSGGAQEGSPRRRA